MRARKDDWHLRWSLIKSGFRILAGGNLAFGNFMLAGILLIVAELVGIIEEF